MTYIESCVLECVYVSEYLCVCVGGGCVCMCARECVFMGVCVSIEACMSVVCVYVCLLLNECE